MLKRRLNLLRQHFFINSLDLVSNGGHDVGLFGFDKIGPEGIPHLQIHYWSGIQKALTKLGAKVIVAGVPR